MSNLQFSLSRTIAPRTFVTLALFLITFGLLCRILFTDESLGILEPLAPLIGIVTAVAALPALVFGIRQLRHTRLSLAPGHLVPGAVTAAVGISLVILSIERFREAADMRE
jgi:hypothetical protein